MNDFTVVQITKPATPYMRLYMDLESMVERLEKAGIADGADWLRNTMDLVWYNWLAASEREQLNARK